jgi:hypothetical protein
MFREITIDEPLDKIIDDWDFFEDRIVGKFSTFRPLGQNIFGIRRRAVSRTEVIDTRKGNVGGALELGPTGIKLVPHKPLEVHVTTGGTPHRVRHSFGFWHVNDMDELYLPIPSQAGDPLGHFVVIQETPRGNEGESFVWYCEACLTLLWELHYPTGAEGFQGFWKAEERAVRLYNSELRHRTCPECGHVNPMGYCWNTAKDTEDERAARALW